VTKPQSDITLVQDSREQFGYQALFQTPTVVGGLVYGDYSVAGLESLIAIERKSLPDLLGSLTQGRDRFETELKRARSMHRFFLLVECYAEDILNADGFEWSRVSPRSVWGSLMTWTTRYHPILFGGTRETSARICEAILVAYARDIFKGTNKMQVATAREFLGA
jgi:ERCC4-type nuclease